MPKSSSPPSPDSWVEYGASGLQALSKSSDQLKLYMAAVLSWSTAFRLFV